MELKLAELAANHPFGNLELLARQVVEGFITGLHRSPFHGFSVEFAEHRLYNNGETVRNIDWKLFARTDKLFVKRYQEETNLRCQLLLDVSSSMFYPQKGVNKLLFSICAAASLINLLKRQRDAFGMSYFSDELEFSSPVKSTTVHQHYLYNELEKLIQREPTGTKTDVSSALHQIAEQVHKRSLIILFSDMLDQGNMAHLETIFSALQHIKHNKHEIIIFNVNEKGTEIDFNFEDRPHQFLDLETGESLKVNPSTVKEAYREATSGYQHELFIRCAQLGIDLVNADINEGFNKVLQSYLIKRNKMS